MLNCFFSNVNTPFLLNRNSKDPFVPNSPSHFEKYDLTSATVLLLLFVAHSTKTATPKGA